MIRSLAVLVLSLGTVSAEVPNVEIKGSLVIVGGGKMPDSVRVRFVELAGKEKAKIVVIPTASEYADKPEEHEGYLKEWKKLKPASVQLLHTRDRKVADSAEFIKPLDEATGIWFNGGDQARLTASYLSTKAEKAFRGVLERGGVLGGTSAGAAIMSDPMITGGNPVATTGRGFGFLPGVIVDQHFLARKRQDRLKGVLEKNPGTVGIGIDESTAIVVKGKTIEVLGDSVATIYLAPGAGKPWSEETLKPKAMADLMELRRAAATRTAKHAKP